MTKILSWYYIFAFVAILCLAVYLYQRFRIREGQQTRVLKENDEVKFKSDMMSVYAYGIITEIKGNVYTIFSSGGEVNITFNGDNIKKIAVGDKVIDNENDKPGKITNYDPTAEDGPWKIKYDDNSVPPDFVDLKKFSFPID